MTMLYGRQNDVSSDTSMNVISCDRNMNVISISIQ